MTSGFGANYSYFKSPAKQGLKDPRDNSPASQIETEQRPQDLKNFGHHGFHMENPMKIL
jgi:hypothetical protein